MVVIIEVAPHPTHRICLVRDGAIARVLVVLAVDIVNSGDVPSRPLAVEPLDLVGHNLPVQNYLVDVCVEACGPAAVTC